MNCSLCDGPLIDPHEIRAPWFRDDGTVVCAFCHDDERREDPCDLRALEMGRQLSLDNFPQN